MSVYEEAVKAVDAARSGGLLEESDDATVATLLHIAKQIDSQVGGLTPDGKLDNVSVPTFLKYAEALGLTPLSRHRIRSVMKESSNSGGGESTSGLSKFRSITGGKTA